MSNGSECKGNCKETARYCRFVCKDRKDTNPYFAQ